MMGPPLQFPAGTFDPFYDTPCCFRGTRPDGHRIATVVNCCVFEDGDFLGVDTAEAGAPSRERTWTLRIPIDRWTEPSRPQIGDEVDFRPDARLDEVKCRVSAVADQLGDYVVAIRERKPKS
ncbi:MAG: hypothetical protein IJG70_05975 [Kiritimatiellae bacterium]|nr:hypothetical protein [Kiritimatiellia bacterium]